MLPFLLRFAKRSVPWPYVRLFLLLCVLALLYRGSVSTSLSESTARNKRSAQPDQKDNAIQKPLKTETVAVEYVKQRSDVLARGNTEGDNVPENEGTLQTPETDPVYDNEYTDEKESKNLGTTIPVLVIACNRPTVSRCIDSLLKHRPADSALRFPIIISQDCQDSDTADVIESYGDKVTYIRQPDTSEPKVAPGHEEYVAYYKIARHYRWALNKLFKEFMFEQAVIVEDDMEVAPDFFDYFEAFLPVLKKDSSLFCVSAWNDNGKDGLAEDPYAFYRSSFFPGLGWMLRKEFWSEIEPKWPQTYWDDWLRNSNQRLNRGCIRPEVSRTFNFGKKGVSGGLYYDQHIGRVILNSKKVKFTGFNRIVGALSEDKPLITDFNYKLSQSSPEVKDVDVRRYLKENYDNFFIHQVYTLSSRTTTEELKRLIESDSPESFEIYKNNANLADLIGSRILGTGKTVFDDVNSIRYCGTSCQRRFLITYNRLDTSHPKSALVPQSDVLKQWDLMEDIREDCARVAYKDIVTFKIRLKHTPPTEFITIYIGPEKKPPSTLN